MNIHPNRQKWLNKRLLWLGGGFMLLLVILAAVARQRNTDVSQVDIRILDEDERRFVNTRDIKNIIQKKMGVSLEGRAVGAVDIKKVEKVLEEDPFIRNADVYVDMLGKVHIKISQCEPIVRINGAEGRGYYLDETGKYTPTSMSYAARVPVVTGATGAADPGFLNKPAHRANQVLAFAKYISKDLFLSALIEQIHVESNGDFILVPKIGDHTIAFGPPVELDKKFKRLKIFYKEGLRNVGWEKYKLVSVKYANQVVAVKR